jgi:hypothetical protein
MHYNPKYVNTILKRDYFYLHCIQLTLSDGSHLNGVLCEWKRFNPICLVCTVCRHQRCVVKLRSVPCIEASAEGLKDQEPV